METRCAPVAQIQAVMFGAEHHSPAPLRGREGIAQLVASRAWAALADTLRDCLSLEEDPGQAEPEHAAFKPWSGWVWVSMLHASSLFPSLLLNASSVRVVLRSQPGEPTAPKRAQQVPIAVGVEQALADHKLTIRAQLAECELDLGTLQGLRAGDIVPLPHALDEPLLVSTPAYGTFCAGFLGRLAGSKAIELLRHRESRTDNF